ncbi:GNAT family N-acetyltransferase [Myceligenerans sp. I2]|uniref:GNAT family N-acetyltransferase n=2 Tax=Myceligenerans indicum TaxID=2593663 RepID=A0ABS1LNP8_9MICO|nr:GNAT family N-acetyltransferase [Myceligenerans indicum]
MPGDATLLEHLWLLFRHELSGLTGTLPNPDGTFRRERLDAALADAALADRAPADTAPADAGLADAGWRGVLAHATPPPGDPAQQGLLPRPVGFALVRGLGGPTRVLNSFFVVAGARRAGVGRRFAAEVIACFPGPWEIAFQDANAPAVAFWRAVATDAAGQAWTEEHRPVPGRPDVPPDTWISFTTSR